MNLENWSTHGGAFRHRWPMELYHLEEDPGEERNVGGDAAYASARRELLDRLLAWMRDTDDAWFGRMPADL